MLYLHIACGSVTLMLGTIIMFIKKGGKAHRKLGLAFFWAMCGVVVSAIYLGMVHNKTFLLIVGVFSGYMNLSGYRVMYQKKQRKINQTNWVDYLITGTMALFSIWLVFVGLRGIIGGNTGNWLLVFFGLLSGFMLWADVRYFTATNPAKTHYLTIHIARMVGCFIASVTAFLVVNLADELGSFVWVAPTLVLTPVIVFHIRRVSR